MKLLDRFRIRKSSASGDKSPSPKQGRWSVQRWTRRKQRQG